MLPEPESRLSTTVRRLPVRDREVAQESLGVRRDEIEEVLLFAHRSMVFIANVEDSGEARRTAAAPRVRAISRGNVLRFPARSGAAGAPSRASPRPDPRRRTRIPVARGLALAAVARVCEWSRGISERACCIRRASRPVSPAAKIKCRREMSSAAEPRCAQRHASRPLRSRLIFVLTDMTSRSLCASF